VAPRPLPLLPISHGESSRCWISSATIRIRKSFVFRLFWIALVAQWIERCPPEAEVAGSNPAECATFRHLLLRLLLRYLWHSQPRPATTASKSCRYASTTRITVRACTKVCQGQRSVHSFSSWIAIPLQLLVGKVNNQNVYAEKRWLSAAPGHATFVLLDGGGTGQTIGVAYYEVDCGIGKYHIIAASQGLSQDEVRFNLEYITSQQLYNGISVSGPTPEATKAKKVCMEMKLFSGPY
jgi:hypothetical protein